MAKYEGDYDELRPCPACGFTDVSNRSRFITRTIKKADGTLTKRVGIERACSRCQYIWYERALFEIV